MKQAQFIKTKIVSAILVAFGVIASVAYWILQTRSDKYYWVYAKTYSFINPISGKTVYSSGADIADMSLFQFAASEYMDKRIYTQAIAILAVFLILAILVYAFCFNQELTVSNKGICGKALKGKPIEYEYNQIASVKKSLLKGIKLKTIGQKKISFWFLKNRSDIIEIIAKNLSAVNATTGQYVVESESATDQITKYKDLLDTGVISQEEYDAKKKQLLGL